MVVTSADSKIGSVLYDFSERDFERSMAVSEIPSKSRKQVVRLSNGLFPPKKDKRR